MKLRSRLISPLIATAAGFAVAFPLFYLCRFIINELIYAFLCDKLPSVFTMYNPITSQKEYEIQNSVLNLISIFLTLYVLHRILLRCDSHRYKATVTEKGGMFRLSEGIGRYLRSFALWDVAVAAVIPLLFTAVAYCIPKVRIGDFLLTYVLSLPSAVLESCGLPIGAVLLALLSLAARLLASLATVRDWRAIWLSDIVLP